MRATVNATGEQVDIYPLTIKKEIHIDEKRSIRYWIWAEFHTGRQFEESELTLPESWSNVYQRKYYQ